MTGMAQYREDITKHFEFLGYIHENKLFNESIMVDAFTHPKKNAFTLLYAPYFIVVDQYFSVRNDIKVDLEKLMYLNTIYFAKCVYHNGELLVRMFINHYERENFGNIIDNFIFEVEEISKEIATM